MSTSLLRCLHRKPFKVSPDGRIFNTPKFSNYQLKNGAILELLEGSDEEKYLGLEKLLSYFTTDKAGSSGDEDSSIKIASFNKVASLLMSTAMISSNDTCYQFLRGLRTLVLKATDMPANYTFAEKQLNNIYKQLIYISDRVEVSILEECLTLVLKLPCLTAYQARLSLWLLVKLESSLLGATNVLDKLEEYFATHNDVLKELKGDLFASRLRCQTIPILIKLFNRRETLSSVNSSSELISNIQPEPKRKRVAASFDSIFNNDDTFSLSSYSVNFDSLQPSNGKDVIIPQKQSQLDENKSSVDTLIYTQLFSGFAKHLFKKNQFDDLDKFLQILAKQKGESLFICHLLGLMQSEASKHNNTSNSKELVLFNDSALLTNSYFASLKGKDILKSVFESPPGIDCIHSGFLSAKFLSISYEKQTVAFKVTFLFECIFKLISCESSNFSFICLHVLKNEDELHSFCMSNDIDMATLDNMNHRGKVTFSVCVAPGTMLSLKIVFNPPDSNSVVLGKSLFLCE